ncbi:MAG: hypothetical protein M1830_010587 [Pleopsidium flavum]|nr:MAG: hypothetical protein M1830_010587 [Pleopsidium flavum]
MVTDLILRLSRSDSLGDYVLVHVSTNGASPLDLKLIATEGEAPYVGSVKQASTIQIQTKNYQGSDEEWNNMLSWIFLRRRLEGRNAEALLGLETVASIAGTKLTITLRKNIGGITQRLGIITLEQDESQAVELFEWAGKAVEASTTLETEVASLSARYRTQQETLAQLNHQLENLIRAKAEHEDVLLEKFMELINAKKLKIRDQQRLLAGAKVEPDKAGRVRDARGSTKSREPAASRSGKRKKNVQAVAAALDSDGDVFEEMDVVKNKKADSEQDEAERASTPNKSDLDATEDEDDLDLDPVYTAQPIESGIGSKGKAIEVVKEHDAERSTAKKASPPPRRDLPFAQQPRAKGVSKEDQPRSPKSEAPNNEDGVETEGETDDDEL